MSKCCCGHSVDTLGATKLVFPPTIRTVSTRRSAGSINIYRIALHFVDTGAAWQKRVCNRFAQQGCIDGAPVPGARTPRLLCEWKVWVAEGAKIQQGCALGGDAIEKQKHVSCFFAARLVEPSVYQSWAHHWRSGEQNCGRHLHGMSFPKGTRICDQKGETKLA